MIALTFPLLLPIIITVGAIGFALVLVMAALLFAFYATVFAFIIGGAFLVVTSPFTSAFNLINALFNFGAGLSLVGLGLLFLPWAQRGFRTLNHRLRWIHSRRD